jgi:hypothetical protein
MTHPSQWAAIGGPSAATSASAVDATAGFVINLCASTTPLALARPKGPEFAGYAFFVSRRMEDGRERFRLHMGHFSTRVEAERLLPVVREIYPAAWVGEMPGRRLRALPIAVASPSPAPVTAPATVSATAPLTPPAAISPATPAPTPALRDIDVLSPQDTQSWKDIRAQLKQDAPLQFAVQLMWSVTPIDLAILPKLTIFDAYTLYRIEGNRDGRKWYGLRLGFFSDSDAAKQVAAYVRAEFTQVAVVPVSARERGQAEAVVAPPRDDAAAPARARAPAAEDDIRLFAEPPPRKAAPASARRAAAVVDHEAGGPTRSVDETLEILGADALSLRGERPDDEPTGRFERPAAALPVSTAPPRSRFARFLDRLTGRGRRG